MTKLWRSSHSIPRGRTRFITDVKGQCSISILNSFPNWLDKIAFHKCLNDFKPFLYIQMHNVYLKNTGRQAGRGSMRLSMWELLISIFECSSGIFPRPFQSITLKLTTTYLVSSLFICKDLGYASRWYSQRNYIGKWDHKGPDGVSAHKHSSAVCYLCIYISHRL